MAKTAAKTTAKFSATVPKNRTERHTFSARFLGAIWSEIFRHSPCRVNIPSEVGVEGGGGFIVCLEKDTRWGMWNSQISQFMKVIQGQVLVVWCIGLNRIN